MPVPTEPWLAEQGGELIIRLWVNPTARHSRLMGVLQQRLHVQLAAPAGRQASERELCRYVAALLRVARPQVRLLGSAGGPRRALAVQGIDALRAVLAVRRTMAGQTAPPLPADRRRVCVPWPGRRRPER